MKTVYVGMSGGVDSSVSAALLKEQGFNVVGVYMKNWTQDVAGVACPWKQDLADARAAAAVLDIPFQVFDFQAEYKQHVVDTMVAEYAAGRTPNPDILCNQQIKFDLFLRTALRDGADLIATGHYARVVKVENRPLPELHTARDANKDQTYFLYRVTAEALKRTLFPVGELTKPEVRRLAAKFGLPTAKKPDSQGICFVGEVGIREFLRQHVPAEPGPVLTTAGRQIGTHEGALFYTHGQRHGLGIGGGKPFYVTATDIARNTVTVTDDPADVALTSKSFTLEQMKWIGDSPTPSLPYLCRVRHRAAPIPCSVDGSVVTLHSPARAVTPGQSAVIYDGERVLGGGVINS
jgi:tRNA-uridine 2-sulfurtransferase